MFEQTDTCRQFQELLVQYSDGDCTPEQAARVEAHIGTCDTCRSDLEKLQRWKGVSKDMQNRLLPDMAWDEYWQHIYNRLERGIGWILVSIGAIIMLGLAVYHFVVDILASTQLTGLEKTGIIALSIGFVVLLVSVIREKLMVKRYDKYKEIQR